MRVPSRRCNIFFHETKQFFLFYIQLVQHEDESFRVTIL